MPPVQIPPKSGFKKPYFSQFFQDFKLFNISQLHTMARQIKL
jgi:hypothetical protein